MASNREGLRLPALAAMASKVSSVTTCNYLRPAARAGLPATLRFYDLRHTAASLLIPEGASVKAVQRQLGHATASITLNTYGHLFPDELDALPGRLEDLHGRALAARRTAEVWPHGGPAVVAFGERAGQ